jgi:nitrogen regulatory protein P-II 1
MKRIEAFFQFGKLEEVVEELERAGATGLTVLYARGRGEAERSKLHMSRGTKMTQPMFNLIDCVIIIVEDDLVETIVQTIKKHADTTRKGIITVSNIESTVKI